MDVLGSLGTALLHDRVLQVLVGSVLLFLLVALVFAGVTFALRLRHERKERLWRRLEERWEGPLLEAMADPERVSGLQDRIEEGYRLHFLDYVLQYARRVGGTERETLKVLARPFLPLILPELENEEVGIRARAVQTVGLLGLPLYTAEVRSAMDDPSPLVAVIAAQHLAHEAGAVVAPDVLQTLDRFSAFSVGYLMDMVVALGPDAIPPVRLALEQRDRPVRTRIVAARSLATLRDLAAADLAAELTTKEEDPELLAALLQLIAAVGTEEHLPAVRNHLDSEHFFVRMRATRALAELGTEEDLPLFIERLSDPSPWVAMAAARGAYRLGGEKPLSLLAGRDDPVTPLARQILAEEGG